MQSNRIQANKSHWQIAKIKLTSSHLFPHVNVVALAEGAREELGKQAAKYEDKTNEEDDGEEELLPSSPNISQDFPNLRDNGDYTKRTKRP